MSKTSMDPHSRGMRRRCGAFAAATLIAGPACASDDGGLLDLINAYRSEPRTCEGRRTDAAGPLAPARALVDAQVAADRPLLNALKAQGYQAAQTHAIAVSGPGDAQAVMALLQKRYCRPLLSPNFAEIGISHQAERWTIVLARPLIPADLGNWREAGHEILRLANEARAQPRTCGSRRFDAAPSLAWAPALGAAALAHSRYMAERNEMRHRGADGSQVGDRVLREGYAWRQVGENVAAGQGSPRQAVSAWLSSPPHCANVMHPGFAHMGAAYAMNPDSEATIYWTQVFGTPRDAGRGR